MRLLPMVLIAGCARSGERPLVAVTRADLVITVDVSGELAAADAIKLAAPSLSLTGEFHIASLAPEGSEVAPGDPVVTLDPGDIDRSLESRRTELAEATQRLERETQQVALRGRDDELRVLEAETAARKAGLKLDVPHDLIASLDLREQQLDDELARLALAQARSSVALVRRSDAADLQSLADARDSARHRVDEAERARAQLALTAPRAGTVVYGDKHVGDSVYGSDPIVQIVALGAMVARGEIDEVDLARVAVQQPVTLRVDALPDLGLHGTIASIASSVHGISDADPNKVVQIEIAVAPTRGAGLRPGMRFRGRIETGRLANVVQLPAEAVFVTPEGPVAYRDHGGDLERVRLELGRRTSDAIEVVAGVSPGDRVSRVDPAQEAP